MRTDNLTQAYLHKAKVHLEALGFFKDREAYSDVVPEAQELVELLMKAVFRAAGAKVPKVHDVGKVLEKYREHLPQSLTSHLHEIRRIRKRLRKERELSFYGADDFIPTEEYHVEDAEHAICDATFVD
ncbi:MAG: HEPN domain-containing protein [Desulfosoma sp.]